ncbi:hypothetical protein BQ1740_4164 [Bacillus subtilis]|nr:hypothetical protein BQ1740_4164 [Bacillus subtilis]
MDGKQSEKLCPCCGFHFGYDDYEMQRADSSFLKPSESIIAYRKNWLADGASFFHLNATRNISKKRIESYSII